MFNEDDVNKIAKLASLALTPEQTKKFAAELSAIFGYVQNLEKIDVSNVTPMSHVHGSTNFFREDTAQQILSTKEGLQNAPDRSGNYFRVPIIIEGSDH